MTAMFLLQTPAKNDEQLELGRSVQTLDMRIFIRANNDWIKTQRQKMQLWGRPQLKKTLKRGRFLPKY